MNLRTPGPTPCPPDVLRASSCQMINHRGKDFEEIFRRVMANSKKLFLTESDVLLLTSSGAGSMEAAIVNFLSPGDRVLALSVGEFGDRFADVATAFGADVTLKRYPAGRSVDLPEVIHILNKFSFKAVLVTHNETSTGITNDIQKIAAAAARNDALVIVDAISSLGAIPVKMDDWGLDVVVTASQKALMTPPGIAMIGVSKRAWRAHRSASMPRWYFDLSRVKKAAEIGQASTTPAISVIFALDAAIEMMLEEGLERIWRRHHMVAERFRRGVLDLGYSLLADPHFISDTVTAVAVEPGTARDIISRLETEHGIVVAAGIGELADRIFRVGHLGLVSSSDIDEVLAALEAFTYL